MSIGTYKEILSSCGIQDLCQSEHSVYIGTHKESLSSCGIQDLCQSEHSVCRHERRKLVRLSSAGVVSVRGSMEHVRSNLGDLQYRLEVDVRSVM